MMKTSAAIATLSLRSRRQNSSIGERAAIAAVPSGAVTSRCLALAIGKVDGAHRLSPSPVSDRCISPQTAPSAVPACCWDVTPPMSFETRARRVPGAVIARERYTLRSARGSSRCRPRRPLRARGGAAGSSMAARVTLPPRSAAHLAVRRSAPAHTYDAELNPGGRKDGGCIGGELGSPPRLAAACLVGFGAVACGGRRRQRRIEQQQVDVRAGGRRARRAARSRC